MKYNIKNTKRFSPILSASHSVYFKGFAEYLLYSNLWVLINSDKVPVIEKPLMLLRKLGPKTANY